MQQNHWLIVKDDKGQRKLILDAPLYSIGRDSRCDICLVSQFVSRSHATLIQLQNENGNSQYQIADGDAESQSSSNGLLINGRKVQVHALQHQDKIVFGPNVEATYYLTPQKPWDGDLPGPNAYRPRKPHPFTPKFGAETSPDEGTSQVP